MIDNLSDFQLYAMLLNPDLDINITEQINKEFQKRNFSQEHIDQLAIKYENVIPVEAIELSLWEKVRIICFPFFIPIQAIIANKYIASNHAKWKQYWKFITIGLLIWCALILVTMQLVMKN